MATKIRTCRARVQPCAAGARCPAYQDALTSYPPEAAALVKDTLLDLPRDLAALPCTLATADYDNPADLGSDALLKSITLVHCERHATYHRYNGQDWDKAFRSRVRVPFGSLMGGPYDEATKRGLRESIEETRNRYQQEHKDAQDRFSTWRVDFMRDPATAQLRQEAKSARTAERLSNRRFHEANTRSHMAARKKPDRKPGDNWHHLVAEVFGSKKAEGASKIPLLVPIENLTTEQLMEFQVCYRKKQFASQAEAQQWAEYCHRGAQNPKGAYACLYGPHFHVGAIRKGNKAPRGTSKDRRSAGISWHMYRNAANSFAIERGLISVDAALDVA